MSNVTRRALRVYAALAELRGNDTDVLDALIPFFEPILSLMNGKVFDPHVFAAGVRRLYRWRFTGDIAATFVPRLERKGILQKQAKTGQGVVWLVRYDDPTDNAPPAIVTVFEQIIDEFEKFPPRVTDLLAYKKNREELKDILIRFLVMMDVSGEGAFAPQLGEMEPGAEARELVSHLEEGGQPLDPNDRYMCARFVQYLMKRRPEFVPHLIRLSSIGLLAEVVEDFLKPTHTEGKTDLTIVLDAPIALDYLGCSGKALKDDIATIISALKKIGATFIVFPASCIEMQRNLRSMLGLPPEQRRGYTHNAMIKREVGQDFVTAVANNPERALENAGITVRQISLDTFPASHRYFTAEQEEDFFASVTWGNPGPAREHDATCLALVMRLREGKQSGDVFKTRFVMVTRNSIFVRQSRKYCLEGRMIYQTQEGPVIHARDLATTAWLRTGLGADETIPRGHLIATCDRVLQVRPEVRHALAAQLARITPERLEQFNLLMQDARSVQKLADETLNNEDVVTSENAEHLLEVMRAATAEELREKHEAEMIAERMAAQEERERAAKQLASLSGQVNSLRERDAQARALIETQLEGIVKSINGRAKTSEVVAATILMALGCLGAFNMATGSLQNYRVWSIVLVLGGVAGFARLVYGLMERPMPALRSLLNVYCRWMVKRRLVVIGLSNEIDRFSYKDGRVMLAERLAPRDR
ncbi:MULTISPECIES: hypothetical protein [unclassified Bradyrhizobium]|uniref:hypothetical protein n=1 Tax=unclassified Bradyrhizobium TaxID=2631580 RepID=UPI002915F4DB|nr:MULTISPECIES: hypothetical protein [unclassified Bradyrhizobium]